MDDLQLLIDLHRHGARQGPGSEAHTLQALQLAGLDRSRPLKIADIGCGTGAAAILLANELDAEVTAVDVHHEFLDELHSRAKDHGLSDKITALHGSMDALPFNAEQFDVIWSEGAIYHMGFEAGVSAWRPFLKPGGILVLSEITWLTATRPRDLQSHWDRAYPEIDVASAKLAVLERHGYRPEAYFVLPESCWLENYYLPLENRFDAFLECHNHSKQVTAMVEAERHEIALYKVHSAYYSYGVYIAKKPMA
jgi:ubiquinone/menaquinone biosynthesis C-methylase UbiE